MLKAGSTLRPLPAQRLRRARCFGAGLALLIAAIASPSRGWAGEAADLTRNALTQGNLQAGEQELAKRLSDVPANDEARFGLAMVRFVRAIEAFGQHQYRYGLAPQASVPFLRIPVPGNRTPDDLTYEAQRAALRYLLDDLDAVAKTLAPIEDKDVKITIDLNTVSMNFAPGIAEPVAFVKLIESVVPGGRARPPTPGQPAQPAEQPPFEVSFDRADAFWLQGYCNLLSAVLEFVLAHDWHDSFERGAGLFYPRLKLRGTAASHIGIVGDTNEIADGLALVHEIRWRPIYPERLLKVREHLKQVVALSRLSWQAILAETDDDHEWIPSPGQQDAAMPTMRLSQDQVNTWLAAIEDFDAVLDGRKLIPHWRFEQGINLRMVLEEPRVFDAVLWATGHAAIPYLQQGPVLSSQTWQAWQRVFAGNFLIFAIYLN